MNTDSNELRIKPWTLELWGVNATTHATLIQYVFLYKAYFFHLWPMMVQGSIYLAHISLSTSLRFTIRFEIHYFRVTFQFHGPTQMFWKTKQQKKHFGYHACHIPSVAAARIQACIFKEIMWQYGTCLLIVHFNEKYDCAPRVCEIRTSKTTVRCIITKQGVKPRSWAPKWKITIQQLEQPYSHF